MASINLGNLILYDRFPGNPNSNLGIPRGGFDNTMDNCVTAPTYPVGTKIQVYTDNSFCPGNYTMMYAGFACISATLGVIDGDMTTFHPWCMPWAITTSTDDTTYEIPDYSGDISVVPPVIMAQCYTAEDTDSLSVFAWSTNQSVGMPCATLEGYEYGWFWVGGVCPAGDITFYRGVADIQVGAEFSTDDAVTQGSVWLALGDSTQEVALMTSQDWSAHVDTSAPVGVPMPFAHAQIADI